MPDDWRIGLWKVSSVYHGASHCKISYCPSVYAGGRKYFFGRQKLQREGIKLHRLHKSKCVKLTFAPALKHVNQYASSSDSGYMPARTPLPHTIRHVSCGTVPFFANFATPLQQQQNQLSQGPTQATQNPWTANTFAAHCALQTSPQQEVCCLYKVKQDVQGVSHA